MTKQPPAFQPLEPDARYYAVFRDPTRPTHATGLERRVPLHLAEYPEATRDEAFTRRLQREQSTFFIDLLFDKGVEHPHVEVSFEEAVRIAERLYESWLPLWPPYGQE